MKTIHIDADVMWKQLRKSEQQKWGKGKFGTIPKPPSEPGLFKGFRSFNDEPDKLVSWNDVKDVVSFFTDKKTFPMFHQLRGWIKLLKGNWNQNGLNWCWGWSLCSLMNDLLSSQKGTNDEEDMLSPAGFGPAVSWRNVGNYLEAGLQHACSSGLPSYKYAPEDTWHDRTPRTWKDGWEENAMLNRLDPNTVYKMDRSSVKSMICHCLTVLRQNDPVYIAYNWWGHALELVGMEWDESVQNNIAWIIRNSHDEKEFLRLTGSRAIPDEAYSAGAMRVPLAA